MTSTPFFTVNIADLGLTTSQGALLQQWVAARQAVYPSYSPSTGDLSYIDAQIFASWFADLAQLAATGSSELFRQFGQKLLNLPYQQGTPATAVATVSVGSQTASTVATTSSPLSTAAAITSIPVASLAQAVASGTITLVSGANSQTWSTTGAAAGATSIPVTSQTPSYAFPSGTSVQQTPQNVLPAGSQLTLTLNGALVGFVTSTTLTIPPGSSSGTVLVQAVQTGSLFNGATNPTALVSQTTWVSGVTVAAPASGGADQEDDDAYLQRLAATLRLLAPRPITAADFATMALDFVPASGTDQTVVGRATAVDGYDPSNATFTVSENSTATLTITGSPSSTVYPAPGATITGANIPANTTMLTSSTGSCTISNAATATATGIAATVTGTLGNQREVTVCVTDSSGVALNADTKTAVASYLTGLREINFLVNVVDPAYTPVYVTVTVKAAAGYSSSTVQTAVQTALLNYLTPANFGLPSGANVGWNNTQTVYRSKLTAVIQDLPSVDHLVASSLAIGTSASPTNTTTDLQLTGEFVLPTSSSSTIALSGITVT